MLKLLGFVFFSVLVVTVLALMTPASGQDRTSDRLPALESRVAALETTVAGLSVNPQQLTETFDLTGTITIFGYESIDRKQTSVDDIDSECSGNRGYDDLREGVAVTVKNEQSTVIATGRVEESTLLTDSSCELEFKVNEIPRSGFYTIEVSHRGGVTYSHDELESSGWHIELSIG